MAGDAATATLIAPEGPVAPAEVWIARRPSASTQDSSVRRSREPAGAGQVPARPATGRSGAVALTRGPALHSLVSPAPLLQETDPMPIDCQPHPARYEETLHQLQVDLEEAMTVASAWMALVASVAVRKGSTSPGPRQAPRP